MQKDLSSHAARLLRRAANIFDSPDPFVAVPYRGFANHERFFLQGRVLENEGIHEGKSESRLRNLFDTLRRFESDEIAGARLSIELAGAEHLITTDKEGYFTLDLPWQNPPTPPETRWLTAKVQLIDSPDAAALLPEASLGEIFYPAPNASFGIISDIDDTVLQTHVTSRLKLKMIYATLFNDSHQRLPMEGVPDLLSAFEKGGDGLRENPFFYVSDSPWNIYDMLAEFLQINQLPKGPILLRDYGPHLIRPRDGQAVHKLDAFRKVLQMYPNLPFVMLGDTASKDADYYLKMAEEFAGRVLAIYIRQTRDTDNARRIAKLLSDHTGIEAVLIHSSAEIREHAIGRGLVCG